MLRRFNIYLDHQDSIVEQVDGEWVRWKDLEQYMDDTTLATAFWKRLASVNHPELLIGG